MQAKVSKALLCDRSFALTSACKTFDFVRTGSIFFAIAKPSVFLQKRSLCLQRSTKVRVVLFVMYVMHDQFYLKKCIEKMKRKCTVTSIPFFFREKSFFSIKIEKVYANNSIFVLTLKKKSPPPLQNWQFCNQKLSFSNAPIIFCRSSCNIL